MSNVFVPNYVNLVHFNKHILLNVLATEHEELKWFPLRQPSQPPLKYDLFFPHAPPTPTPFFPSPSLSLAHAGSAGGLEEEGGHHASEAPHPHVRRGIKKKALIKMTSRHRRRRRDSAPSWLESVLGGGRVRSREAPQTSAVQCSMVELWRCAHLHSRCFFLGAITS